MMSNDDFNSSNGLSMDEERVYRSVLVSSLLSSTTKQDITIHFQSRKNSGGDIEDVVLLGNGSAIITFAEERAAKSVQNQKQRMDGVLLTVEPYSLQLEKKQLSEVFSEVSAMIDPKEINLTVKEADVLMKIVQEETNVKCTKLDRVDVFIVSGSFQQIHKSHCLLLNLLSRNEVFSESDNINRRRTSTFEKESTVKENGKEHLLNGEGENIYVRNEAENEKTRSIQSGKNGPSQSSESFKGSREMSVKPKSISKNSSWNRHEKDRQDTERLSMKDSNKYSQGKNEKKENEPKTGDRQDDSVSSVDKTLDCTHKFDILSKVWYVFVKVYEKELRDMSSKYSVTIEPEDNKSTVVIRPSKDCNAEKFKMASKELTDLYEKARSKMTCVWFSLVDPENEQDNKTLRKTVTDVMKTFPVFLERTPDRQSWEIFGVADLVEKGIKLLEERVKLERKKPTLDDEMMEVDDSEDEINEKDKRQSSEDEDVDDEDKDEDDDIDVNGKLEHHLGKVKLSVYRGDITDEDSDAIVNAANESLYHGAGVAKAIVSKGGTSIQDECRKIVQSQGHLKVGEAKPSHSGILKCKMIIHAVGPNWKEDKGEKGKALLKKACRESLFQAQKYNFKSVAFPAISSGIYGMPKKICAQVMFDVAEEYSKNLTSTSGFELVDVRFVNNDIKTVKEFKKEFKLRYGHGKLLSETVEDTVTPHDFLGRHVGNDSTFTNHEIPRISDTSSNRKVKTKLVKSEHSEYSERSLADSQASKIKSHSRNQENGQLNSSGDTEPTYKPIHPSLPDKENPRQRLSKTGKYKLTFVVPLSNEKEQTSKSNSIKPHGVIKSCSFSGARPKQRLSADTSKEKKLAKQQPHLSSNDKAGKPECSICLKPIRHPKTLPKCNHTFCKSCVDTALKHNPICPYCRKPQSNQRNDTLQAARMDHQQEFGLRGYGNYDSEFYQRDRHLFGQGFNQPYGKMDYQEEPYGFSEHHRRQWWDQRGNQASRFRSPNFDQEHFSVREKRGEKQDLRSTQPNGSMMHREDNFSLPGYEQYGTIVIQYLFKGGQQGPEHPNPGQRYDGTSRSAYLPDNPEGRQVLKLLRKAFDAGLIFKIGTSMTSKLDNQIVWADIPHKTATEGGPSNYGYPDPSYLSDVKQQLQAALGY